MKNNIAVCTSIVGDKDYLKNDQCTEGADFICYSDNPNLKSDIWEIRPACDLFKEPNRNAKIHKILIHQYLSEYDYTLWIDGDTILKVPMQTLIDRFMRNFDIVLLKHHARKNLFEEANECIKNKNSPIPVIHEQIKSYKVRPYDLKNVLYECPFLLRANNVRAEEFNNYWWSEICRHSRRDQLSFAYITKRIESKINIFDGTMIANKYFKKTPHNIPRKVVLKEDIDTSECNINYKQHKKVSIIMLVMDELPYITQCLESLHKYTENFELIIVANGSNKKTLNYIRELKWFDLSLIVNTENKGFPYGCNQGIKIAKYDYLCFLNADTLLSPNWLGILMETFKDKPDAGLVGPYTSYCGENGQSCPDLKDKRFDMGQNEVNEVAIKMKKSYKKCCITGFCYLVKKEVLNKVGVFDNKRFKLGNEEETELNWRAKELGDYECYVAEGAYVHHFSNRAWLAMGINQRAYNREERDKWKASKGKVKSKYVSNDVTIDIIETITLTRKENK